MYSSAASDVLSIFGEGGFCRTAGTISPFTAERGLAAVGGGSADFPVFELEVTVGCGLGGGGTDILHFVTASFRGLLRLLLTSDSACSSAGHVAVELARAAVVG